MNREVKELSSKLVNIPATQHSKILQAPSMVQEKLYDFLDILEDVLDYSDISSVKEKCLGLLNSLSVHTHPSAQSLQGKLANLNVCGRCGTGGNLVTNSCGHTYCYDCGKILIEEALSCMKCPSLLTDSFQIAVVKLSRGAMNLPCKHCRSRAACIYGNACGHLCLECFTMALDALEPNCWHCHRDLLEMTDLLTLYVKCDGCLNNRYMIGDCITMVCSKNTTNGFCLSCMEIMLESKECFTCQKKFNIEELMLMFKKTCKVCCNCQETFSKTNMIGKMCCKKYFCFDCFDNLGNHCC